MTETVTVTASAVRAELTRLLAAVADGQRVEITKHGKVVALLSSPSAETTEAVEETTEAVEETTEAVEETIEAVEETIESDDRAEPGDTHIWGWTPDEEQAFERFLEEEEDEYEDLLETA